MNEWMNVTCCTCGGHQFPTSHIVSDFSFLHTYPSATQRNARQYNTTHRARVSFPHHRSRCSFSSPHTHIPQNHTKHTTQRALTHLVESRFAKADADLQEALDAVMGEEVALGTEDEQVGPSVRALWGWVGCMCLSSTDAMHLDGTVVCCVMVSVCLSVCLSICAEIWMDVAAVRRPPN